jgi:hypothetical protein
MFCKSDCDIELAGRWVRLDQCVVLSTVSAEMG